MPRTPDRFTLSILATLTITFSLAEEMAASLVSRPSENEIATITGGEETSLVLSRGTYTILVESKEIDHNVSYFLAVETNELAEGLSQTITASPASLFAETSTKPIAENDDRKNDWNFQISRQLKPGVYRLQVEPLIPRTSEKIKTPHTCELERPEMR